jgi:hypothetical protein
MKKNTLLLLTLFAFSLIFSQTKEEIKEIIKDYDLAKLHQLADNFLAKSTADKAEALRLAKIYNWPITIEEDGVFAELIRVSKEGRPIYYKTTNVNAAKSTRANTLHNGGSLGLNIEGQGMTAYVWDGGVAKITHQEYDGPGGDNRYSILDGGLLGENFHAAHVTGTIMASGLDPNAKGMAPQALVKGSDWNNDGSEVTNAAANGMLLSNHSYGALSVQDWQYGAYTQDSRNWDIIMYNAPYYLLVTSAGNDGADDTINGNPLDGNAEYDKLHGMTISKNNLVIANAQDAIIDVDDSLMSVSINSGSSEGPTDDYRIKPDIAGNGSGLYSTLASANNDYGILTGTSMASPNVTGSLLLLQQHYNNINGNFMKAATLKGLALHTADDAGSVGPDAVFGWGLLNTKAAANVISNESIESTIINEITLMPGQSYTIGVKSDDINDLIASISWTDPAGTANNGTANDTTPVLVNDLDIRILKNGTTYFPYKLTSITSNTQADNTVDPFERVDVTGATGIYTITVTHKGALTGGSQDFSLIVTGVQFNGTCTATTPTSLKAGTIFIDQVSLTWDIVLGSTYEIRYKEASTSTWITATTNDPNITLTGLAFNTLYDAQVRSICPDMSTSAYSVTYQFPENLAANKVRINPKVFLQGPMLNPVVAGQMNDNLRSLSYLPTTSPYTDAATIEATVFNVTGNNAIVDWIWIEIRQSNDNTKLVKAQSALLQRDGDIVDLDGVSELKLIAASTNYYVVVKHRNHLGAMSSASIALNETTTTVVDFTDSAFSTFGSNAQVVLASGNTALWTGNTNDNGQIKFSGSNNDTNVIKDAILADPSNGFNSPTFTATGYMLIDLDLNGSGKFSGSNNDSNIIKDNVLAHPSNGFNSPTFTISKTVPDITN